MLPSEQCLGTTTKGTRCKLKGEGDGYCRYHHHQRPKSSRSRQSTPSSPIKTNVVPPRASPKVPKSPSKSPSKSLPPPPRSPSKPQSHPLPKNGTSASPKPGFIYMYTFAKLYNGDKSWLKAKNLPGTKKKDQWLPFNAKHSEFILVKIGMTTQSVDKRFKQWHDKCHHDIVDMSPAAAPLAAHSTMSRLVSKFSRLSVKPDKAIPVYQSFRPHEKGFYCQRNLAMVESEIHRRLRNIYGYGDILCQGCTVKESSPGYNMHIEWFLIPKSHIPGVYRTIDSICLQYG